MVIIRSTREHAEKAWAELRNLGVSHAGNCIPLKGGGFGFAVTDDCAARLLLEGIAEFAGTPPLLTIVSDE